MQDKFIKIWNGRVTMFLKWALRLVALLVIVVYAWYDIVVFVIQGKDVSFTRTDGIIIFICAGMLIAFEYMKKLYIKIIKQKLKDDDHDV